MGFSKKQHLQQNIDALRLVFNLEREKRRATSEERIIFEKYSGFGGLKFILNPLDRKYWKKSEQEFFPLTEELYNVLKTNSADEKQYKFFVDSMKSSILTAFYTPPPIIDAIARSFEKSEIDFKNVLEPSAGIGSYIKSFNHRNSLDVTAYEKDLLTGKILKSLYPESQVRISGFEEIPNNEYESYDLITSNIPFGDTSVFDLSFSRSDEEAKVQAARSIHNYFFLKGSEMIRDGGFLAFITSQGVLNSSKNEIIRRALLKDNNLISALRLPNNLFSENAGTDVGSDLIILQKNLSKIGLTKEEELFCQSKVNEFGVSSNNLFTDRSRIIFTESKVSTDAYGKPALIYHHDGGVDGIAADLNKMLVHDFAKHIGHNLFNHVKSNSQIIQKEKVSAVSSQNISVGQNISPSSSSVTEISKIKEERQMSIFDLFDDDENLKVGSFAAELPKTTRKKSYNSAQKRVAYQGSLFSGFHQNSENRGLSKTADVGNHTKEIASLIAFSGIVKDFYKNDCLVVKDDKIGFLKGISQANPSGTALFNPLILSENQTQRAKDYIFLRDTYQELYRNESENQVEFIDERKKLNELYDAFVKKHGNINQAENIKLIKTDSAGKEIPFLERSVGGVIKKADIFFKPVSFSTKTLATGNPEEALVASLNKFGKVEFSFIKDISGMTEEEILNSLQDRIYFNPLEGYYEISETFIAGNITEKIQLIKDYILTHENDEAAKKSLFALEEALPRRINFEELDFNLGERWIPSGIYARFASHLFDTKVKINYSPSNDDFAIACDQKNIQITEKYSVKSESRLFDGIALLKHALVNTTPDITKKIIIDDKEVKVRDMEAIQMANSKIDEIRTAFTDYLHAQNDEFKERLTTQYNDTFNCFVRPTYNGSHQEFPGLDRHALGIEDLYSTQKDAVWMIKLNGGAICDHEVGAGKTLIMCTAAQEMKRLGMVHKPMIIGLKANVHEIAETYRTAYPHAKILYPGKEDFTPQRRQRIFGDIKNNDWDCIILTHDQFGMIPQSPEMQKEILEKELDSVEQNLSSLEAQGKEISRGMLKGVLVRKQNLEVKLKTLEHDINTRKDDVVDFKMTGIDHLLVDESHRFKNLMFNTRHDRVAGLGNQQGSLKAMNPCACLNARPHRKIRDLTRCKCISLYFCSQYLESFTITTIKPPLIIFYTRLTTFSPQCCSRF